MPEALADRRRWICPVCQKPYLIPPEVGDPSRCAKCEKKDRRVAASMGTIDLPAGGLAEEEPAEHRSHPAASHPQMAIHGIPRRHWHTTCAWVLSSVGAIAAVGGIGWGIGNHHRETAILSAALLVALLIWQSLLLVLQELQALRHRGH